MTTKITVAWQGDRGFIATNESGDQVGIKAPNPTGQGMSPGQLLLAALGGCMGITTIGVLEKKRQQVTAMEIDIIGEQMAEWPKSYTNIHMIYKITGTDINQKAAERAVELAETRYCTVSASLAPPITSEIVIVQEEEPVPAI